MGINNVGPNASRLSIVLQHRQLTDEHTMEFCEWFLKQANLLTKRGIDVHIDTINLSNNNVGDTGVAKTANIIQAISPRSFRVLALHHNRIADATPLLGIVAPGLAELHLSHNRHLELDVPLEQRLPFFEGSAECAERAGATTETSFYKLQICNIVENSSDDVCALATARLEHAISMKKLHQDIPKALRLKLKHSMRALRQRERDPWCNELIQPAAAAIYWLCDKRRIRKKSRTEDLL